MRVRDCVAAARTARALAALMVAFTLAGCATRPVNPRIEHFEAKPYTFERPSEHPEDRQNFIALAFSGGGTRAAAFSYGALETLRDMEITTWSGRKLRALNEVDVITGISGGSFTALAYGLYGDKLFDEYEKRFLKRDVQGELVARAFNPFNWDPVERDYMNRLPTSFALPDEAVDRLRAAARAAILESPVIQQLMSQGVVQMVGAPPH